MKVGIVGSRQYENKRKIKEMIFRLKQTFGDELTIVGGGCQDGADKYAKKYALELGCNYLEVNPAHTNKNLYSYMREDWYNKPFSVRNFHIRNKILASIVDRLIAFIPRGHKSDSTDSTLMYAKKFDKKCIIIT
jgi:predicted Rossmann-fold nucleotide-binding protein|tara:strand:- start:3232 stop:3633 length:402 start_codon:yes stop_codon:yes gene_type:complete